MLSNKSQCINLFATPFDLHYTFLGIENHSHGHDAFIWPLRNGFLFTNAHIQMHSNRSLNLHVSCQEEIEVFMPEMAVEVMKLWFIAFYSKRRHFFCQLILRRHPEMSLQPSLSLTQSWNCLQIRNRLLTLQITFCGQCENQFGIVRLCIWEVMNDISFAPRIRFQFKLSAAHSIFPGWSHWSELEQRPIDRKFSDIYASYSLFSYPLIWMQVFSPPALQLNELWRIVS